MEINIKELVEIEAKTEFAELYSDSNPLLLDSGEI